MNGYMIRTKVSAKDFIRIIKIAGRKAPRIIIPG